MGFSNTIRYLKRFLCFFIRCMALQMTLYLARRGTKKERRERSPPSCDIDHSRGAWTAPGWLNLFDGYMNSAVVSCPKGTETIE